MRKVGLRLPCSPRTETRRVRRRAGLSVRELVRTSAGEWVEDGAMGGADGLGSVRGVRGLPSSYASSRAAGAGAARGGAGRAVGLCAQSGNPRSELSLILRTGLWATKTKAMSSISKFGRRYDREFKQKAVALILGGRSQGEVSRDLGVGLVLGRMDQTGPGRPRSHPRRHARGRDARAARGAPAASGKRSSAPAARDLKKSLGILSAEPSGAR